MYGTDISTWLTDVASPDLDPSFALITEEMSVLQGAARRLCTARGSMIDAPDEGIDICSWVNLRWNKQRTIDARFAIEREIERDERVRSAFAVVQFSTARREMTFKVELILAGSNKSYSFYATVGQAAATFLFG